LGKASEPGQKRIRKIALKRIGVAFAAGTALLLLLRERPFGQGASHSGNNDNNEKNHRKNRKPRG
jgi:hypothetical protein